MVGMRKRPLMSVEPVKCLDANVNGIDDPAKVRRFVDGHVAPKRRG